VAMSSELPKPKGKVETWSMHTSCMTQDGGGRGRRGKRKKGKGHCSFKVACLFSVNPKPWGEHRVGGSCGAACVFCPGDPASPNCIPLRA
jgi:hypothetical protein